MRVMWTCPNTSLTKLATHFEGWYYDKGFINNVSTVKINGENVTVYAKWNDVMYMLTVHITSMNVSTQQM